MRLPNKYGSVIKLGGKRRKPYAVRISAGYKDYIVVPNKKDYYPIIDKYSMAYRKPTNDYIVLYDDRLIHDLTASKVKYSLTAKRQYKYLEYFDKAADAYSYLAKMNSDQTVQKHTSITSEPSFKDVYEQYIDFLWSLNNKPSESRLRSYKTGFALWSDVHDIRFKAVTTKHLQNCLTSHGKMSKSSVGRMITILKKMYKYAMSNKLCDTDLSPLLFAEHNNDQVYVHTVFTDDEINTLWDHSKSDDMAKVILFLIYTGLRCTEFLTLENGNFHLNDRYFIGGMKTDAGRNRVVPLHKKIIPIAKYFYNSKNKYFYPNHNGGAYTYKKFRALKWDKAMQQYGMNHFTHDCRKTFASKLEEANVDLLHRKLIIGHRITDITEGVYTTVKIKALIKDIDKWK